MKIKLVSTTYNQRAEGYVLAYSNGATRFEPINRAGESSPAKRRREIADSLKTVRNLPDGRIWRGGTFCVGTSLKWVCSCGRTAFVGDRCYTCGFSRRRVHGW